jgi:hypothetical protein
VAENTQVMPSYGIADKPRTSRGQAADRVRTGADKIEGICGSAELLKYLGTWSYTVLRVTFFSIAVR